MNSIFKIFIKSIIDIIFDLYRRIILAVINLIPGRPGNIITEVCKRLFAALILVRIGPNSELSSNFYVYKLGNITVGKNCKIGSNFKIWNFNMFECGDDLLASHNITVICGTHDVSGQRKNISGPVKIGKNVWIGANTLIVGPCIIGDNVIIGANSYATGNFKSNSIYAGSPAKFIKHIQSDK